MEARSYPLSWREPSCGLGWHGFLSCNTEFPLSGRKPFRQKPGFCGVCSGGISQQHYLAQITGELRAGCFLRCEGSIWNTLSALSEKGLLAWFFNSFFNYKNNFTLCSL